MQQVQVQRCVAEPRPSCLTTTLKPACSSNRACSAKQRGASFFMLMYILIYIACFYIHSCKAAPAAAGRRCQRSSLLCICKGAPAAGGRRPQRSSRGARTRAHLHILMFILICVLIHSRTASLYLHILSACRRRGIYTLIYSM